MPHSRPIRLNDRIVLRVNSAALAMLALHSAAGVPGVQGNKIRSYLQPPGYG